MSSPGSAPTGLAVVPAQTGNAAHATVTETALLRGRADDLERRVDALEQVVEALRAQNEGLRRQVAAMKDGAWLREGDVLG